MKRTKIICTLGPASASVTRLQSMARAGMNVARLNFSHGDYPSHMQLIRAIKTVRKRTGQAIAILQDLQGPRIRTGVLPAEGLRLRRRDTVVIAAPATAARLAAAGTLAIPVAYPKLPKLVTAGDTITIQEGLIVLKVERSAGDSIKCTVRQGGLVLSHKGMNLPGVQIPGSSLTAKDKHDLQFGLRAGVDLVAISFVQSAADIQAARRLIGGRAVGIIAKIERQAALDNLLGIIAAADGIMIARGDLGIELKPGAVPVWQKQIIAACRAAGKPVIVATQMLESMTQQIIPTRAESSDVANAVMDHADAVMLSEETATGSFPIEAVRTMVRIVRQAEQSVYDDVALSDQPLDTVTQAQALHVAHLAALPEVVGCVVQARTLADVAPWLSYRPTVPILVIAATDRLRQQLALVWGVQSIVTTVPAEPKLLPRRARVLWTQHNRLATTDRLIFIAPPLTPSSSVSISLG